MLELELNPDAPKFDPSTPLVIKKMKPRQAFYDTRLCRVAPEVLMSSSRTAPLHATHVQRTHVSESGQDSCYILRGRSYHIYEKLLRTNEFNLAHDVNTSGYSIDSMYDTYIRCTIAVELEVQEPIH